MTEVSSVFQSAHWIVLAPFIAGALIILGARHNKTLSMLLSVGAVLYGFIHSLLIFNELRLNPTPFLLDADWFVTGSFKLTMGILVDNLASMMLIVVTCISLLVQVYTHGYMREDPGYSRFYSYLSLFTGSMLGLVVSTNLFQMYFFWELVGVCSYLLIGFWWSKPSAAAACLKAFVVNRVGDFGFLVGILLFLAATYGFWHAHADHGLLSFYDPKNVVNLSEAIKWAMAAENQGLTQGALTVIALLIFMGPMAKSAQAPLHIWLPDAMEGPTPISALIHAATMVAAGIYMVARAYPIWLNWTDVAHPTTASDGLAFVAWVGGFTAFMAATIALTQFDIKRILAWSTVSQLGYMFVGLGTGGFTGGLFHLFTHAFFKAMLFLCSGAVIHGLHGEQDVRKMGGLWGPMKISAICCLIGTISISGIPPFAGFFSKDEIIASAYHYQGFGHELLGPLVSFTAFLTAFYMFRMFFMTFAGSYRGEVKPHHDHVGPLTMPLMVLAVPSIVAGFIGAGGMNFFAAIGNPEGFVTPFAQFVHFQHPHKEVLDAGMMTTSTILSALGIVLAAAIYWMRSLNLNEILAKACPPLYQFSLNKWYFDNLFLYITDLLLGLGRFVWLLVDWIIVDGIVNGCRTLVMELGDTLKYTENGRGQSYALTIFAGVGVFALYVYFGKEILACLEPLRTMFPLEATGMILALAIVITVLMRRRGMSSQKVAGKTSS